MSVRRPVLTPDHPAPVAAAHRQAGYPHSLAGTAAPDHHPPVAGVVIWLAACGGAALLIATPARSGRAAAACLGLAPGRLFDGDISAKLVGCGGPWLAALATLIVTYTAGTSLLPSAYQRGDGLTTAGTATIMANAVPITVRVRAVRPEAAARDTSRPAAGAVRVPGGECRRARTPADAPI
jgi:hypothetical protein